MVIAPLTCSLVEQTDTIELRANTLIAKAYGREEIEEGYHCNYGVSPEFAQELESGDMRVTGWDEQGEIGHGLLKRSIVLKKTVLDKAEERTRLLLIRQANEQIRNMNI